MVSPLQLDPQVDLGHALSDVVEVAPYGVALTMTDGRIVLTNAELERMFGYARAVLLGHRIEDLVPERFRSGHAMMRLRQCNDPPLGGMGPARELIGLRADASEFPIEIGINALETPRGSLIIEAIVDRSVHKHFERVFPRILEAAPCGMMIVDARGTIVLVNPQIERMFGYSQTELIGNALEMLQPERFRARHDPHRQVFFAAPLIRRMGVGRDLTARRKDGTEFPVEIRLSPLAGEEVGLVLAVVIDVTHHKAIELGLHQTISRLEEFAYAASHDLKSPLRGIADLVEWISEDLDGKQTPAVSRNLQRVGDRVRRLERVIDDLLAYAQAGATESKLALLDPEALIDGLLEIQPPPPGFTVAVRVDALPLVAAKAPLATVLRNLLSNAIEHHDLPAGRIDIHVEDVDRYCVFSVADDGPGIPAASQKRVFQMFQTLAAGKHAHSGIGLALSKRLVESHGGHIVLESKDGVRGTTFRVRWPRSTEKEL
jgi:PAS domain S-box-containing protein